MFTDIVSYTALTQTNEQLSLNLLEEHRRLLRAIFSKHSGRAVKTVGDAFLAEFRSALKAATCAVEIQKALRRRNSIVSRQKRIEVRIGLHLGDVVHTRGDVFGDAVNIASRVVRLAKPGGICLSEQVYDQIYNKVELPLVSVGRHHLKNLRRSIEVYELLLSGEREIVTRDETKATCAWCLKPLDNRKISLEVSGELVYFDSQDCLITYRKFKGVYGETFR